MKRVRAVFRGRVQGVFFRAHTKAFADEAGVAGWVRNRPDGSVEALFEGEERSVDGVIHRCRVNQPHAFVEEVELTLETARADLKGFEVRR
jgi:acylphosphatase